MVTEVGSLCLDPHSFARSINRKPLCNGSRAATRYSRKFPSRLKLYRESVGLIPRSLGCCHIDGGHSLVSSVWPRASPGA